VRAHAELTAAAPFAAAPGAVVNGAVVRGAVVKGSVVNGALGAGAVGAGAVGAGAVAVSPTRGYRLTRVRDCPPVAFRATPEAVYLVGTAACPVGDDQVQVDVRVQAGATLAVRSAASTIAWASTGSSIDVNVSVEAGGSLDWHLQPLIASAKCHLTQRARVRLGTGARLRWAEEIALGRHSEGPGWLDLRLDVDIDEAPLLRHQLVLGPGSPGWDGPAVLGGNRAIGFVLLAGTDAHSAGARIQPAGTGTHPARQTAGPGWAVMPLESDGTLVTAVGRDLLDMRTALARGLHQFEVS
jgi:urease accessory protein